MSKAGKNEDSDIGNVAFNLVYYVTTYLTYTAEEKYKINNQIRGHGLPEVSFLFHRWSQLPMQSEESDDRNREHITIGSLSL